MSNITELLDDKWDYQFAVQMRNNNYILQDVLKFNNSIRETIIDTLTSNFDDKVDIINDPNTEFVIHLNQTKIPEYVVADIRYVFAQLQKQNFYTFMLNDKYQTLIHESEISSKIKNEVDKKILYRFKMYGMRIHVLSYDMGETIKAGLYLTKYIKLLNP